MCVLCVVSLIFMFVMCFKGVFVLCCFVLFSLCLVYASYVYGLCLPLLLYACRCCSLRGLCVAV